MRSAVLELGVPGFAFAFGAVVGSFLNVVIYRLARDDDEDGAGDGGDAPGEDGPEATSRAVQAEPSAPGDDAGEPPPPTWGELLRDLIPSFVASLRDWRAVAHPKRSFCPRCKAQIAWYDNLPLISYFALGAKCRRCKAPIPIRYFVVEMLTACLFALAAGEALLEPVLAGLAPAWGVFGVTCLFSAAMVAAAVIDLDRMILPDAIDKPGLLVALALAPLVPALHLPNGDLESLAALLRWLGAEVPARLGLASPALAALAASALGAAAGAGVIYGIGWLGKRIFRKEAMGFGDVKYMAMIGALLGWKGVLLALLCACFAGAFIGIIVKAVRGSAYIPFGPFLTLGALIVLFARAEVIWAIFEWYPSVVRGAPVTY